MTTAQNPDDEIEASRAPLLDHLSELRERLFWAVMAILACFVVAYIFKGQIWLYLTEPFLAAIRETRGPEAVKDGIDLINTSAFGFFFVQMKVALFAAIVAAFPVISWQVYAFVAPGLYKRERAAVMPFLIAAPVMFLAGCAFVFYVAMPYALIFALSQEVTQGAVRVKFTPRVDEYLSLLTTLVLAFGLVFQVPVMLSLLARIGVVGVEMLRKGRRYAIVGIAAFSALVTPPDPISMMIMAIPVYVLYEISIWVVWLIERARLKADAEAAQQVAE